MKILIVVTLSLFLSSCASLFYPSASVSYDQFSKSWSVQSSTVGNKFDNPTYLSAKVPTNPNLPIRVAIYSTMDYYLGTEYNRQYFYPHKAVTVNGASLPSRYISSNYTNRTRLVRIDISYRKLSALLDNEVSTDFRVYDRNMDVNSTQDTTVFKCQLEEINQIISAVRKTNQPNSDIYIRSKC